MNVWFAPAHPSHLVKNRLFLDKLVQEGCRVTLLCLDRVYPPAHATLPGIRELGLPFVMLEAGGFRPERHWLVQSFHKRALLRRMRSLLQGKGIDAMVFGTDGSIGSLLLVRAARGLGVPTVLIPDGLIVPPNPRHRLPPLRRGKAILAGWVQRGLGMGGPRGTSGTDLILAMNDGARRELVRLGVDPARILVTGSPQYLHLAENLPAIAAAHDPGRLRKALGIPERRPVVFFAHQTLFLGDEEERELIRTLAVGARGAGATLLVKFHPRSYDQPAAWRAWADAERFGPAEIVFLKEGWSSLEVMSACSVCVTVYSTTALEAMIFRKPLIVIDYVNSERVLTYAADYGVALAARSPAELQSAIASILRDARLVGDLERNRPVAMRAELGGTDSRGSLQRMFGAVERLVRGDAFASSSQGDGEKRDWE